MSSVKNITALIDVYYATNLKLQCNNLKKWLPDKTKILYLQLSIKGCKSGKISRLNYLKKLRTWGL